MQSTNQNMNLLQISHKNITKVKASDILETFAKASRSHSVRNLCNNNSRFIGARITDNT